MKKKNDILGDMRRLSKYNLRDEYLKEYPTDTAAANEIDGKCDLGDIYFAMTIWADIYKIIGTTNEKVRAFAFNSVGKRLGMSESYLQTLWENNKAYRTA